MGADVDRSTPVDPTATEAWSDLARDAERLSGLGLAAMFEGDPGRVDALSFTVDGLSLDLSKDLLDAEVLAHLCELARQTGVEELRDAMLSGARINTSEERSVLHTALRLPRSATLELDGVDVVAEVHEVLDRMGTFCDSVRDGTWRGATGERISHVVNIGIGGSYLGPEMAARALRRSRSASIEARFVANVDGADFEIATAGLEAATTLFVISSKTFTTLETMTNAKIARDWVVASLGEDAVARHFVAVSTNAAGVEEFGIDRANMFGFWEFVGGRYSMDSAIGLSTMLLVGPDGFAEMLAGFHAMDQHFAAAPVEENLPMLLGLLRVWYSGFLGATSIGVMPYSADLARLPAYLQQLEMESNGKGVNRAGQPLHCDSGLIFWGEPGTDGQHSFYQLLHQGTRLVPLDLIGVLHPMSDYAESHELLLANLFAQGEALAFGRSPEQLVAAGIDANEIPFRTFTGDRPSSLLLLDELSPFGLGLLIALYEHEVFTQGAVWAIDSFDQWGVELGKVLAQRIIPELESGAEPKLAHDSSTNALIRRARTLKRAPG